MGIPTNYPGLTPEMVSMIKCKAYALSLQYGFTPEDREDIEQDMALHLLDALPSYNPRKGAISTFADRVIVYWTSALIRNRSAARRSYKAIACSLDDLRSTEDGECERLAESLTAEDLSVENMTLGCIERVELKADVERIIAGLPPKLRDLCAELMAQTVLEYCEVSGIPRSTVESRVKKLQRIFMKAGFGKY